MAFDNQYRFYILEGGTDYLYVTSLGGIASSLTPIPLKYAPKNWEQLSIKIERGWEYYGLYRTYTIPFDFVKDGATILRWAMYLSNSVESRLTLKIEKLDTSAATYGYYDYLTCEINLASFADMKDFVSVELLQSDFVSKLKSRANTMYEIDLDTHPSTIWVKLDGIKLDGRAGFLGIQQPTDGTTGIISAQQDLTFPTLNTSLVEGRNKSFELKGNDYIDNADAKAFAQPYVGFISSLMGDKYIIKNTSTTESYTIRFKGSMTIIMETSGNTGAGQIRNQIRLYRALFNTSPILEDKLLVSGSWRNTGLAQVSETLTFDDTIVLGANECIWFYVRKEISGSVSGNTGYILMDTDFDCSWINRYDATYIPCLYQKDVFSELVSKIGDNTSTSYSALLSGLYNDIVITSGDGLRSMDGAKIKISFQDFFKYLDSYFNVSLMYDNDDNELLIESKEAVFDEAITIDTITNINDFKLVPLIERMPTKITAGCGKHDYDEINGKDEFNQDTEYLTPVTKVGSPLDLTSPIRTDMYGIEYTRINYTDKETTDSDNDNDTFAIHINPTSSGTVPSGYNGAGQPYFELYRKPIDLGAGVNYFEIQNLIYPETAFNVLFSPKRTLLRWANYISSVFFLMDNDLIAFQTKYKTNRTEPPMKTLEGLPIVTIDEGSSDFVADFLPNMFMPYLVTFKTPDRVSLIGLVDGTSFGKIDFLHNGDTYSGFPISIEISPTDANSHEMTLLLCPTNNLLNLVYAT